jgi:hypothetical protein
VRFAIKCDLRLSDKKYFCGISSNSVPKQTITHMILRPDWAEVVRQQVTHSSYWSATTISIGQPVISFLCLPK